MNRRSFLKCAGLLTAAFSLPRVARAACVAAHGRCRVTVLRRQCFPELQGRYLDDPEEGPCTLFHEGQTFECGAGADCPEGFCPKAWECVRAHVEAVTDPTTPMVCGSADADGAVIACCSDGTRPVVFKIERLAD